MHIKLDVSNRPELPACGADRALLATGIVNAYGQAENTLGELLE